MNAAKLQRLALFQLLKALKREKAECFYKEIKNCKRLTASGKKTENLNILLNDMEKFDNQETNRFFIIPSPEKNRCVHSKVVFEPGRFLLRYKGDLLSIMAAKNLEKTLPEDAGCFMFYFTSGGKNYAIDATSEPIDGATFSFGRLVNHSKLNANAIKRVIQFNNQPSVILVSSKRIEIGDEILYDYGETRPHVLEAYPFLKT